MNRLKGQRAYLAGAIDRVPDRGAGWRNTITPFLKDIGVVVYDPLNKPTDIGLEDESTCYLKNQYKAQENWKDLSSIMKTIRSIDLRLVDKSDFLIVNLDLNIHPCGTYEEIFWANQQKKPIIIHVEQGKKQCPDWLFGTIPHQMIFSNWMEVRNYINDINSLEKIEDYKRWYFFDT
jgi:hypothetical protein